MGIPVKRIQGMVWALAGIVAAVAGILYASKGALDPTAGFIGIKAFAAAVIIAHLAATSPQGTIDGIAVAFVASRILFTVCYVADWASARTLVWAFGMGCIVALFVGVGS